MKPVWHHKNMYNRHKIVSTQLNNQRKIQTFLSQQIAAQAKNLWTTKTKTQQLLWSSTGAATHTKCKQKTE
jgi:hypothetical protein